MLSLELDVENVSRATRTDPQGDSVTRLLLQGQVVVTGRAEPRTRSLGKNHSSAVCPLTETCPSPPNSNQGPK